MPLFIDIHRDIAGLTGEALESAHKKDLACGPQHDVKYLRYWFNEHSGSVMCLVEAPNKEAAIQVHREAHGLVADEIFEVQEGS